jgi:hypothetical protein
MWIGFVLPTMLLAFDFAVKSATYKGMVVEHLHYVTYFLWLMVCIMPVMLELATP